MSETNDQRIYDRCIIRVGQLEAENERLRELVRDMWNGMCGYEHECRSCEHYELYEGQRFVGECEYHRRMRELGVVE